MSNQLPNHLSPAEVQKWNEVIHADAREAMKVSLMLNAGGVLALLAFFSGKEVGASLRVDLLLPLATFTTGATLILLGFAARVYADRNLLSRSMSIGR